MNQPQDGEPPQKPVSGSALISVFAPIIALLLIEAVFLAAGISHAFMQHDRLQGPRYFLIARGLGWLVLWYAYRQRRRWRNSWLEDYFSRAIEMLWLWCLIIIFPIGLTLWGLFGQGLIPPETAPDFEQVNYAVAWGTVIGSAATYLLIMLTWLVTALRAALNIYDLRPRRAVDQFPSSHSQTS